MSVERWYIVSGEDKAGPSYRVGYTLDNTWTLVMKGRTAAWPTYEMALAAFMCRRHMFEGDCIVDGDTFDALLAMARAAMEAMR